MSKVFDEMGEERNEEPDWDAPQGPKCITCDDTVSWDRVKAGKKTCSRICWELHIEEMQRDKMIRQQEVLKDRAKGVCAKCQKEFEQSAAGRPKTYCSYECRIHDYTDRRVRAGVGTHYGFKRKSKKVLPEGT